MHSMLHTGGFKIPDYKWHFDFKMNDFNLVQKIKTHLKINSNSEVLIQYNINIKLYSQLYEIRATWERKFGKL